MSSFRVGLRLSGLMFVTSPQTPIHTQNKSKNNCKRCLVTFALQIVCKITFAKPSFTKARMLCYSTHQHISAHTSALTCTIKLMQKLHLLNETLIFTHMHVRALWCAQKMHLFEKCKLRNPSQCMCRKHLAQAPMAVNSMRGVTYIIVVHMISMYNGTCLFALRCVHCWCSVALATRHRSGWQNAYKAYACQYEHMSVW